MLEVVGVAYPRSLTTWGSAPCPTITPSRRAHRSKARRFSGSAGSDEALLATPVYLQLLQADAGASKGVSFTQGLRLVLGG